MSSKMRHLLFQHHGIWAVALSLLALCLLAGAVSFGAMSMDTSDGGASRGVRPSPVSSMVAGPSASIRYTDAVVDIAVVPSSKTVLVNEIFTLDIYVYPNGQQVDTVDADMTFNPAYLEVQSITGDSSGLDTELYSAFDNSAGTLIHSRGKLAGAPPSSTFRLCSILLKAQAATPGTILAFTDATDAYFQGLSVLRSTANGTVINYDLDGDGDVDIDDIMLVASRWRTSCDNQDPDDNPDTPNYDPHYDLDEDCDIDIVDIMLVVAHWTGRYLGLQPGHPGGHPTDQHLSAVFTRVQASE